MSKVILTQEQARMFENHKDAVKTLLQKRVCDNCPTSIDDIPIDDVVKAIVYGYEVEPEFKVGDWVVTKSGHIGEIEFINKVEGWVNIGDINDTKERGVCLAKTFNLNEIERHLTPSEIAEEKERRWWVEHDRKPWELRERDILTFKESDTTFNVTKVDGHIIMLEGRGFVKYDIKQIKKTFTVACFAENRLDVKDDE